MNKVAQNQLPLSASFKSNYAKELEMQIKERDRIKRIESDNREYAAVKKISYDGKIFTFIQPLIFYFFCANEY